MLNTYRIRIFDKTSNLNKEKSEPKMFFDTLYLKEKSFPEQFSYFHPANTFLKFVGFIQKQPVSFLSPLYP